MKFKAIKGTKDILPAEAPQWQALESSVRSVMGLFNYREVRTPIFEETALFARSIGEGTDIVTKEMYTFDDKGGTSLTLRPEGTASALRAYVEHNLGEQSPIVKLFYIGPMFRFERPQAGRLRQFHQFGAEALGSSEPAVDAEIVLLAMTCLERAGLKRLSLSLNSVGCSTCRPKYRQLLIRYLKSVESKLSAESKARIDVNPLRVLDSKAEDDIAAVREAPLIVEHLCEECGDHFDQVQLLLKSAGASFIVNGRLVRGLDYYTKTAFEVTSDALGAQDAVAGGGRYDSLVAELGGKETPGIGFAAGMERILIALNRTGNQSIDGAGVTLYLAAADEESRKFVFTLAHSLRAGGTSVETDTLQRSLKAQLREANRQGSKYVAVIGEEERSNGSVRLKHMATGKENIVRFDELSAVVRSA